MSQILENTKRVTATSSYLDAQTKKNVVCGVDLDQNNEVSYGCKDDTTCQNIWS